VFRDLLGEGRPIDSAPIKPFGEFHNEQHRRIATP
jgi:hypothetical protein